MTDYKLVPYTDPILYKPTEPFDFSKQDPKEIFETLREKLLEYKGYGLSANQIGIPYSVFVFGNSSRPDSIMPVFNPKIVNLSSETDVMEEGCLTFPGLIAKMERSKTIRVRYTNIENVTDAIKFDGLTARIFQHEMCHINGKPFYAGYSKLKLDMIIKKCAKKSGIQYNSTELMKLRK